MSLSYVWNIALYLLFVFLGYQISGKIKPPQTREAWLLWVAAVIVAGGICVSGYAVNINETVILGFNDMLQAIGMGILIGFAIARSKQDKPAVS